MPAETSTRPQQIGDKRRPSRPLLCTSVLVAALANAFVPAVLFSDRHLFGHTDLRYRAVVAAVVLAEYAIVFLLLLFHANVGFAGGYAVATAAIVTLGSAGLAFLTLEPLRLGASFRNTEIPVAGGIAFAIVTNIYFLAASVRYSRAIHPRLHLGGFFLGIAASLGLLALYSRILS